MKLTFFGSESGPYTITGQKTEFKIPKTKINNIVCQNTEIHNTKKPNALNPETKKIVHKARPEVYFF